MPLLTKIEAAIALGVSVELLEKFVKKCPKPNGTLKLVATVVDGQEFFSENELQAFHKFLNEPWPLPPSGGRPNIPPEIKEDIKQESHHACAICGLMDNGEIAHIEAVATSLNNSPSNLIFLCPNHHTKYDLGFKPASNVTPEVLKAAKLIKRNSRVRMLRVEADVTKTLRSVVGLLSSIEEKLKSTDADSLTATVYVTEAKNLLGTISKLTAEVKVSARNDADTDALDKLLSEKAPSLVKLASANFKGASDATVRSAVVGVVDVARDVLIDIDEVECPHCGGAGTTGLRGDFCAYCHGAQVVTEAKAESYDLDEIDEVDCPHCAGRGQTGLAGDFCSFCRGSQVMSQARADEYDPDQLDEVECPHCCGRGQVGLAGHYCSFCRGSQVVSSERTEEYDPEALDEVECPHCNGSGQSGLAGDFCSFCRGATIVSRTSAEEYDPDDLDEVECPHCGGRGQTGLAGDFCFYCRGSQTVSRERAAEYDPDDLDEVECPHCGGRGQTGLAGNFCALCKGSQVVSDAKARAYRARYRS